MVGSQMHKNDERRDSWVSYPLGLFTAALRSIVGGFVVVMLALSLGTWLGDLAWSGHEVDHILASPLMALGMLLLAGVQLWGWVYLFGLIWLLHYLIHDDGSRILAFLIVVPIQGVVTYDELLYTHHGNAQESDSALFPIVISCVLILGIGCWYVRRRMLERSAATPTDSTTTRQGE